MDQSRKTYDRAKLYFEMTFSLTSPSVEDRRPETGENNLIPRVLSLLQEVEKGPWERGWGEKRFTKHQSFPHHSHFAWSESEIHRSFIQWSNWVEYYLPSYVLLCGKFLTLEYVKRGYLYLTKIWFYQLVLVWITVVSPTTGSLILESIGQRLMSELCCSSHSLALQQSLTKSVKPINGPLYLKTL